MSTSNAVPGSSSELTKFWQPPPSSTLNLPEIKQSLSSFPSAPLRISRVAQLDATLLDNELEGILHQPVKTALEGVTTPGKRSWEPEVLAMLRLGVLRMSLWENQSSSYGESLQNLRYRNEAKHTSLGLQSTAMDSRLTKTQKLLYTLLFVLPPYLHVRLQDTMLTSSWSDEPLPRSWASLIDLRRAFVRDPRRRDEETIQWKREWKRSLWELLGLGEKLGAMAALANFLVFLYNGRHRTLVDRVLKMRLVYAQRSVTPNVSFEYLNRQLVWEAFTEFLLFLMPLINLHKLRLRLSRTLTSRAAKSRTFRALATSLPAPLASTLGLSSLAANSSSKSRSSSNRPQGSHHFLPSSTCPICYQRSNSPPTHLPSSSSIADPTNPSASLLNTSAQASTGNQDTSVKIPYVADCGEGCRYCYYCIVGTLAGCEEEAEESWECLRCGGQVTAANRELTGEPAEEKDGGEDSEKEEEEEESEAESEQYA